MKIKLISVFVCLLLVPFAVPAVKSSKNILINPTVPNTSEKSMAGNWTEIQKILASDGIAYDYFGNRVSLDGDTALIGAYQDDDNGNDSGSAYVFTRSGTTWTQQVKLLASDGTAGDYFGCTVSVDGDTALIGAYGDDDNGVNSGSAYIFTRNGTTWTQQAKLLAFDGSYSDVFGWGCISLDGDTALIGAYGDSDNGAHSGSAYVFTRSGTTWTQQAKLLASDGVAYDDFGCSVSLDGDSALIGAMVAENKGSAYVFTRTGTTWTQQAKLIASDGEMYDWFGMIVFLDGDTALIGAPEDDDNGNDSGSAYIFTRSDAVWTQQEKLLPSDGSYLTWFGSSVSLSDDTALIGAVFDDNNGGDSGSAYIFTRTGTTWIQQTKLLASDGAEADRFGGSVSLSDDTALIGANMDDESGDNSGSVYVFTTDGVTPNLEITITGGIGINAIITNIGTANASIDWLIKVEGGIFGLINKTMYGTSDILAGESEIVKTGLFLGFGPIMITVKAADIEQTVEGNQFFIFTIIKK